ncbi:hypothetical protein SDC9_184918 [bioreactor metagenome]|uniref:Uncharacterized protein n=1 Tax=bioreactor metagenome TaxID=1076179 RepID=A0A645HEG2_9ZZZZ
MLGGSPISVAVPPTFDAKTEEIINGIGFTFKSSAMLSVTCRIRSMVVTLSRKADNTPVINAKSINILTGSPFAIFTVFTARYSNTPVLLTVITISIILTKSPMVLKSI